VDPASRNKLGFAGAVTFAALLGSYSAFRPVRDQLILDRNPDSLPWLWLGTFAVISIVSPMWSKLLARRAPRQFVALAFHVFAACAVAFFVLMEAGVYPVVISRVFYVWSAVFNLFVISIFWSLLADLLGPSTARQLYGPIAAGGTVGGFFGPLLTLKLVGTITPPGVVLMSAVLLELAVLGVLWLRRIAAGLGRSATATPPAPDTPIEGGALTGIRHVARSRYLSAIVGYVLCTAFAATFLYLAQARFLYEHKLDPTTLTQYFATVDTWTQGVAFVLQTVVAGTAIRWLGPGLVLAVLPLVQAVGLSMAAIAPSVATLTIVQIAAKSTTHGLTRPARELLFTVITRDEKYRAKNAIDTIGYRFGDVAAGWFNTGLKALGAGALAVATFPLVAIWLVLAAAVGIGFRRRVRQPSAETLAKEQT
jgi:ATP:ADP antiporter, AAA family